MKRRYHLVVVADRRLSRVMQRPKLLRVFVHTSRANRPSLVYRFLLFRFHHRSFRVLVRHDGAVFVHFSFSEDAQSLDGHAWMPDVVQISFARVNFRDFWTMPLHPDVFVQIVSLKFECSKF